MIQSTGLLETDPTLTTQRAGVKKEFDNITAPASGKPLSVAVYSFSDKTGQRRPVTGIASLSTAVTQGAETFLIQALQNVGKSQWFDVVERVGIDNLTKERMIIKQMREAYEGPNAKPLMPMQFAGIIMEGGIIGYDTTTTAGGAGMRIFGIGKQTQWSTDTVTVSLRAVSVNTGKVLAVVTVQKTILSTADSATVLKFFDQGTQAFEAEAGLTINEPGTYAVKAATEMAVVELIKEGVRKSVWEYKQEPVAAVIAPSLPTPVVVPVISSEIKKDEVKVAVEPKLPVAVDPAEFANGPVETKVVIPEKVIVPEKKETISLFSAKVTKRDLYVYKEQDEKGTKKWFFKKGTVVSIREVGNEGWVRIADAAFLSGWIKVEELENKSE